MKCKLNLTKSAFSENLQCTLQVNIASKLYTFGAHHVHTSVNVCSGCTNFHFLFSFKSLESSNQFIRCSIRAVTGQHSPPESCVANKTKMFSEQKIKEDKSLECEI